MNNLQIRDPIHGVIYINARERDVIDSQIFQRLRNIKQLGFADFAFPGAIHSRFAHSLGAMHVATQIFDRVFFESFLTKLELDRFRQLIRLAALLHDLGHPPLSHTTEKIMPTLNELNGLAPGGRQATHEDYTLKLIRSSELSDIINSNFAYLDINSEHVAKIIEKDFLGNCFYIKNINYGPLLSQIISSEIDCDRMDYLLRDSFYCGVNYGKFDKNWLLENLMSAHHNNAAYLGLRARAIFAFEDFLLSRYHMFVSVYLHHTPVIMEKMLERFFMSNACIFSLPSDTKDYIALNDIDLWQALRLSSNSWAKRITEHKPYVMLLEQCESYQASSSLTLKLEEQKARLEQAGIDVVMARSKGILSHYAGAHVGGLWVASGPGNLVPLEEYAQVFGRYQNPAEFVRIFVDKKDFLEAQKLIKI
jgi:HD superfamily phosphohydrolase